MKAFLLTIFLGGLWTAVSCQVVIKDLGDFYQSVRTYSNKGADKKMNLKDINGSPYLNDEFAEGEVITANGYKYQGVKLRYNIFNDQVEYLDPEGKELQIGIPEMMKTIKIGGNCFVYTSYLVSNTGKKGYFECLNEGDILLLKRYEIRYELPGKPEAYKEPELPKFIKKPNTFYLKNGNTAAIQINGTKSLFEVLNDKQTEIQGFIKKEKLNVKKEDDLLKVVNYYCSLK